MGKPEALVEVYLVKEIEKLGGIAYKFSSTARRNVPDRLCALPYGNTIYVEVKTAKGVLSKGQHKEFTRLTDLKQPVFILSSKEEVDELIVFIKQQWRKKQ